MNEESRKFFETVRDYLLIYMAKQRGMSRSTIDSYKQTINQYLSFLVENKSIKYENICFGDWSAANINEYLLYLENQRSIAASTRNQRLFAIRAFMKYARMANPELGHISLELQSIAKAREDTKPVAFLSEKAVQCLLSQPGTTTRIGLRDSCFMVLMYDTAARDCEMLSLRINSLNLDRKCPTARLEGKGNKVRYVPLMKKTAEYVRKYLEIFHPVSTRHADDWLFYTVSHSRRHKMSDDNVARFLAKYAKLAHTECEEVFEKVTPHQFRHTRAMHLYRNGMPLQLLSEFMGHASLASTQIYAYADTEMKRQAIEKTRQVMAEEAPLTQPAWQTDDEMIKKLYGLE